VEHLPNSQKGRPSEKDFKDARDHMYNKFAQFVTYSKLRKFMRKFGVQHAQQDRLIREYKQSKQYRELYGRRKNSNNI
jgi:hypothetical protein